MQRQRTKNEKRKKKMHHATNPSINFTINDDVRVPNFHDDMSGHMRFTAAAVTGGSPCSQVVHSQNKTKKRRKKWKIEKRLKMNEKYICGEYDAM